jgi:hypothetical protein
MTRNEYQKVWKEAVAAKFKALLNFHAETRENHKKPCGKSHPQSWDLNQGIPVNQPRRSVKWLQQATKNPTVRQISNLAPPKYGAGVLLTRQVRSVYCIYHYGG